MNEGKRASEEQKKKLSIQSLLNPDEPEEEIAQRRKEEKSKDSSSSLPSIELLEEFVEIEEEASDEEDEEDIYNEGDSSVHSSTKTLAKKTPSYTRKRKIVEERHNKRDNKKRKSLSPNLTLSQITSNQFQLKMPLSDLQKDTQKKDKKNVVSEEKKIVKDAIVKSIERKKVLKQLQSSHSEVEAARGKQSSLVNVVFEVLRKYEHLNISQIATNIREEFPHYTEMGGKLEVLVKLTLEGNSNLFLLENSRDTTQPQMWTLKNR